MTGGKDTSRDKNRIGVLGLLRCRDMKTHEVEHLLIESLSVPSFTGVRGVIK